MAGALKNLRNNSQGRKEKEDGNSDDCKNEVYADRWSRKATDRQGLARNAQKVLGYDKLAQAMTVPDALLFTLRTLNIEPFIRSKVVEYKDKKAKPGMWSGHRAACWWAVAAAAFLIGAVKWQINWSTFSMAAVADVVLCLLAVVFAITCLNYTLDSSIRGQRITRAWDLCAISNYGGNIPAEALQKAIAIKTALPATEIYIDRLLESAEKVERPAPDPFLMVKLGNERYWIDVWDEAKYETFI